MGSFVRSILLLYVALVVSSCAKPKAQSDCGFVKNVYGERVSWKNEVPIKMYLHSSIPSQYEASLRAAAETWNRAYGRTLIQIEQQRIQGAGPGRDNLNVIYLLNTWEADRASEQARTSLYWVGDQIQEADIRINALNYQFYTSQPSQLSTGVNFEALLLHELGHVIGLRHNDASPSVMATYLKSNQDRTQLQGADLASLQCEY